MWIQEKKNWDIYNSNFLLKKSDLKKALALKVNMKKRKQYVL